MSLMNLFPFSCEPFSSGNLLRNFSVAACLTALGIPFSERPAFAVSGDSEPVVNWLFDESSLEGKFKASEMIARWQDKGWITRTDNEHPLAYMAAAMRNLHTLISHHIGQAPKMELVKRGNKTLVIPEGTPESQLSLLINKFTRG